GQDPAAGADVECGTRWQGRERRQAHRGGGVGVGAERRARFDHDLADGRGGRDMAGGGGGAPAAPPPPPGRAAGPVGVGGGGGGAGQAASAAAAISGAARGAHTRPAAVHSSGWSGASAPKARSSAGRPPATRSPAGRLLESPLVASAESSLLVARATQAQAAV